MPQELIAKLKSFGHEIDEVRTSSFGVTQAIEVDPQGQFIGVHDPRVQGKAASGSRPAAVATAP
jgi:gamma-glutamyltranspeptidase